MMRERIRPLLPQHQRQVNKALLFLLESELLALVRVAAQVGAADLAVVRRPRRQSGNGDGVHLHVKRIGEGHGVGTGLGAALDGAVRVLVRGPGDGGAGVAGRLGFDTCALGRCGVVDEVDGERQGELAVGVSKLENKAGRDLSEKGVELRGDGCEIVDLIGVSEFHDKARIHSVEEILKSGGDGGERIDFVSVGELHDEARRDLIDERLKAG